MNQELCWLIVPVCGLFSQIGGTWEKAFRRYGIPILMAITWSVFVGWSWWLLLMMVIQWASFFLPITFKGDSIPNNGWFNWVWLPILGVLQSSSPNVMNHDIWGVSVFLGCLMGLFFALSNIPKTAKYFPWKFVEIFEGAFPATVLCFAITL